MDSSWLHKFLLTRAQIDSLVSSWLHLWGHWNWTSLQSWWAHEFLMTNKLEELNLTTIKSLFQKIDQFQCPHKWQHCTRLDFILLPKQCTYYWIYHSHGNRQSESPTFSKTKKKKRFPIVSKSSLFRQTKKKSFFHLTHITWGTAAPDRNNGSWDMRRMFIKYHWETFFPRNYVVHFSMGGCVLRLAVLEDAGKFRLCLHFLTFFKCQLTPFWLHFCSCSINLPGQTEISWE